MFTDINILSNTQGRRPCAETKSDFSILFFLTKSWIPTCMAVITVHKHLIQCFLSAQDPLQGGTIAPFVQVHGKVGQYFLRG